MYFDAIAGDPERCARVVPLTELSADLGSGGLPDLAWISPNLCNDGHDCPQSVADGFLRDLLPTLLPVLGPRGVVVLAWDEAPPTRAAARRRRAGTSSPSWPGRGRGRPRGSAGRPTRTRSCGPSRMLGACRTSGTRAAPAPRRSSHCCVQPDGRGADAPRPSLHRSRWPLPCGYPFCPTKLRPGPVPVTGTFLCSALRRAISISPGPVPVTGAEFW